MTFEEQKEKRKNELQKAIKEQEKLVASLKKDFDDLDKFKKGNVIVRNDDYRYYYLIVGEPILCRDTIKVPIRHHVYATYGCGNTFKLDMNMSGVIDYVEIWLDKIPEVEVISPREVFYRSKETLIKEFKDYRLHYEHEIKSCENRIEELKKKIEWYKNELKEYEKVDIESEFDNFVERYLEGSFEKVAFEGCNHKNWEHSARVWVKID